MTKRMDSDGYPTEQFLEEIKQWPVADFHGLMKLLAENWHYSDYISEHVSGAWFVSTGGWSGNEDILAALYANAVWSSLHWRLSLRGGHYVFAPVGWKGSIRIDVETPKEQNDEAKRREENSSSDTCH